MRLTGKKAIVLVDQLYQELEVWYPLYRLREEGAEAILVGPEAGVTYPSKVGYPALSEKAAGNAGRPIEAFRRRGWRWAVCALNDSGNGPAPSMPPACWLTARFGQATHNAVRRKSLTYTTDERRI